jgi:deoxyribodipyrimidine photo-lyase
MPNQPQTDHVSHMSKYLHFGHISPVYVALRIREANALREDVETYLEELIVRRELTIDFCFYTSDYDSFSCIPDWARQTLKEHQVDEREHLYTREELEGARTHDPYWNAAMVWRRSAPATSTTTCACTGERRSWSGAPRPKRPTRLRCT